MMNRLRRAWHVLTGRLIAIDHCLVDHIDFTTTEFTHEVRKIVTMALADLISQLTSAFDNAQSASATAVSNAQAAQATAEANAAAAEAKAADLQNQVDTATAALNAELAKINGTAPTDQNAPAA